MSSKSKMIPLLLLVLVLIVAVAASAQDESSAATKSHDVAAEFVAVDNDAKTITFKNEAGEQSSAPAEASALADAKKFKAGDKITLVCRDNEQGHHQSVSKVKSRVA